MHVRTQEVQQGMVVYDDGGRKVGYVAYVFPGESDLDLNVMGLRDLKERMQRLMDSSTDFPLAVYSRFYRSGFMRVKRGMLQGNAYFIPDQIQLVVGERVHLRVSLDDLLTD